MQYDESINIWNIIKWEVSEFNTVSFVLIVEIQHLLWIYHKKADVWAG